ncbi:MAG: ComF family protein [Denitrovibrio sp.]|nr:MAG: ComF family protein [Denitrovibrio sp.]
MLSEIFYRVCLGCSLPTEDGSPICSDCLESQETYPYACESCGYPSSVSAKVCGKCTSKKHRDKIFIAYKYRGAIKSLIRDLKFNFRITGHNAVNKIISTEMIGQYDLITDVPSHFTRRFRRFSHPATVIAKYIAINTKSEYKKVLKRSKRTEYQFKLRKSQRISNVFGAFSLCADVRGLKILLVDDIITTGSTIEECSRVLKKSGASKVDVFAMTGGRS